MATTRLIPLHAGEGRSIGTAISDIIGYVENPEKTEGGKLISGYKCDSRFADAEFLFTKKQYEQKTGRQRGKDNVIAYHLRQAFVPGEITPEEANRLGRELAMRFTKGKNAFIVCTHTDKSHIHNHIIFNSVNLDYSRKFRDFRHSWKALSRLNDTICIENGFSIVELPKGKGKSYNKWQGDTSKLSHRDRLCLAIDEALAQKPQSFDAFLSLMKEAGYEVKGTTNPSFRGGSQQRGIRMDTLGPGYSAEELRAVIAGEKEHKPRRAKQEKSTSPRGSNQLLIDIQAKLAEGKGPGYEKWAKKYNLKQMAQTVAYLQDHDLMDYETLVDKATSAAERYRKISEEIKSAEQRMAEIAAMEKQIINYARTREVYLAYRNAGYSKKFLAEHESEIAIHNAAKQFFDEQNVGKIIREKLPSIKSLKAEYAQIMAQKKTAYPEYRKAREEMKELLTAKANIEQILGIGDSKTEQKNLRSNTREGEKE